MKPPFLDSPNVWLRASRTHVSPAQYGEAITFHQRKRSPSRLLSLVVCAAAVVSFVALVLMHVPQQ